MVGGTQRLVRADAAVRECGSRTQQEVEMDQRGFDGGPAQLVLTASVARRYYVDGRSKVDIAEEFQLSRFKVARLIESARTSGLVRIEIGYAGVIDVDLSSRLQETFGLRHALVIDSPEGHPSTLRKELGRAAADLLSEIVTGEDVLGLAWARAVSAMTASLTRLAATPVVQLTGALARKDADENSIELVREAARISGGPAYLFYAPLIVPDAATAAVMRHQPEIAEAFAHFGSVTKAVVGLGSWEAGQSTLYDAMRPEECEDLGARGVIADISGVFVDAAGAPVEGPVSARMIGIDAAQMQAIPEVIAIVYGAAKASAVRAAVRGGLVNALVTHASLARTLIGEG
jgi:DNA-binding transcriptional regulator LsrR (DeoR family)